MSLNIREAEERAKKTVESENICPEHPANVMGLMWSKDFLALAALYREAVEALEKVQATTLRLLMTSEAKRLRADVHAITDAGRAKAREALKEGR